MDEDQQPANDYFQSLPLDYRIGSVHLLAHRRKARIVDIDTRPEVFREHVRLHLGGDLKRVVLAYFDKLMRMIGRGGFDFIGHADKISYNVSCCEPDILGQQWYKDKISEYFTFIAEKGAMIEVNTKTLHRNGFLYPNKEHFGLIRTLGIPVVVNSDAHRRIDQQRTPRGAPAIEGIRYRCPFGSWSAAYGRKCLSENKPPPRRRESPNLDRPECFETARMFNLT